jgi:hypothetical protein
LPTPPRKKGPVTFARATYNPRKEYADDFGAGDGFPNFSRDGGWLRAWPDLANPM